MGYGAYSTDVIVIGDGITGLSTALHLAAKGIKCILIGEGKGQGMSYRSPGLISGGQGDNFTRFEHRLGRQKAARIWKFGDRSFDHLLQYLEGEGLFVQCRRRLRMVVTPEELLEAREAVLGLNKIGVESGLIEDTNHEFFSGLRERVLAIQDDGWRGGIVNPHQLLAHLRAKIDGRTVVDRAVNMIITENGAAVRTAEGRTVKAEFVVIAMHTLIPKFVPVLEKAIVPVADQYSQFDWKAKGFWESPGIVFSAHHGYEWGGTKLSGGTVIGGGRFLRELAGIGSREATVDAKIQKYLATQVEKTFSWVANPRMTNSIAGIDIYPCDELPIIGPLFGEGRILVATGYMGNGLTQGFFAGKCITDIVAEGQCLDLPQQMSPTRLRSLSA